MTYRPVSRFRREKAILGVLACALCAALSLAATREREQIFKGQIIRCVCAESPDDAAASPGSGTLAQCTDTCVKVGAKYVLSDPQHKMLYQLDDQRRPKSFAAMNVVVIGTLDQSSSAIHVLDIVRDIPLKAQQAKTASIFCDACPRAMAKARRAAYEELTSWKRFTIVPDPSKADLVFLVSANPYLGDFLTREGPDQRPVSISKTYLDVVDPHTGASLWGDYVRSGSWFAAKATKDLVDEFREQLELDQSPTERQLFIARHMAQKAAPPTGK